VCDEEKPGGGMSSVGVRLHQMASEGYARVPTAWASRNPSLLFVHTISGRPLRVVQQKTRPSAFSARFAFAVIACSPRATSC
jgi:hypothetical protein